MTKLSKAQVAILRRMAEGDVVLWLRPIGWYTWGTWKGDKATTPQLRQRSMNILENAGLVVGSETLRGTDYTITPAGRAYLEGL